jgi:hypothetical protein
MRILKYILIFHVLIKKGKFVPVVKGGSTTLRGQNHAQQFFLVNETILSPLYISLPLKSIKNEKDGHSCLYSLSLST